MSEDKTHTVKFDVVLASSEGNKIQMMGIIMDITGWGLKQAKDLIDHAPGLIVEALPHSQATEIAQRLEAAGAAIELRRTPKLK